MASEDVRHTLHELRVHQVELEMQNEELRRAQLALDAAQARYFDLYDRAPVGYCSISARGLILEANLTAAALLGVARKALADQPMTSFIFGADQDAYYLHHKALLRGGAAQSFELRLVKADGCIFWAHLNTSAALGADGTPVLRVMLSDVSERRQADDELRIAAVAFASQNGMVITDPQGVILRVNPAFTRLSGYSPHEAIGHTMALLKSGRHDDHFYQRMWTLLKEDGYWQGVIWNQRKNGQIYAEMLSITAIITPDRGVIHYVGSFTDITQDKEAEAEIHRLAYYDALTGLPNRRLLQDRLGQALAATARSGLYGAIFFLDIDNFKALNDTRGHDVGDVLLVEVAQRLRSVVREGDTVARQGGDEFVVLMEDLGSGIDESAALAKQLGEKLREAVDRPIHLKGRDYHCTLSIGVGLLQAHDTVEELFKHADLALYQAKNAGRNALRFFDPAMQAALDLRSALETELRQSIELKQLRLYYQPQVDAALRVIGVEALLRWQHPQRGLVPPHDFIPLAEDTGLILPMGLWVLETACAQLCEWADHSQSAQWTMAVNVSALQFSKENFVATVAGALRQTGANPRLLKLELTESILVDQIDMQDVIAKMNDLKVLGLSVSLDDFGTGYSSLSYLKRLPLDQLKIDQSFVRDVLTDGNDAVIARTIVALGHSLGLKVIAEGVETTDQHDFLAGAGCDAFQGYLFGRPAPASAMANFIADGQHGARIAGSHGCDGLG